jgi:N-acetylmuramic acid 6-phosphate etherase
MEKTTEAASNYPALDQLSRVELLQAMNAEDQRVPQAVASALPQIIALTDLIYERMSSGGRLFYLGAGTSGRLGIVDASECPPTFGVPQGRVVGIIAGGDGAIRQAVEFAEDDTSQGWQDLKAYGISSKDIVVGLSASGTTPYVLGALAACNEAGIATGCIVCNAGSPIAATARHPIEVIVGPEVLTGSTRLKAGTAQKLVLNMLTTAVMVRLGFVKGSQMVDMQLTNAKLIERGTRMVMAATGLPEAEARERLLATGSVRKAIGEIRP